jgi:hypothetical protein
MTKKRKKKKDELRFLKRLTIIMGIIAILIVVGIGLIFLNYDSSKHNIDIQINPANKKITKAVPFEIEVEIDNNTQNFLRDVKIMLDLEEGFRSLRYDNQPTIIRDEVGTISENSLNKKSYRLLPIGNIGEEYEINGNLSYKIGKTSFEKSINKKIKIDEEPFSIEIEKPEQILAGSTFDVEIKYENKTDFEFSNLELEINYPKNFNYISSSLNPTSFNNYWILGTLKPKSSGSITIKGSITTNNEAVFNSNMLLKMLGNTYSAQEENFSVKTEKSPVNFDIKISGNENYVAKIGDNIHYKISYKNGTGITLKDSVIKAELIGDLFDFQTLTSNAKLDSLNNTLIWDKTTTPELELLNPGEDGTVEININLKNTFPIKRFGDKNFSLKINSSFESPTVPYYISANKTTAGQILTTKVKGMTLIDAKALYRDASSGIVNNGNLPPKIGKETEFTVHWIIRNYSTDIKDVYVSASLPKGVEWTDNVKSDIDSVPIYKEGTKEVVWKIDEIQATKGVLTSPLEAIFQLKVKPTSDYLGNFQPILSNTKLEAVDKFTNEKITDTDLLLNTSLIDDPTVQMAEGIVTQ